MITRQIAITSMRSYAVPRGWKEGAAALGVNRWRAMWTVSVRAARPAIIAGAVLACARALGEAIMLSMVSGSKGFAPNPADGLTFIFEPLRVASTIVGRRLAPRRARGSRCCSGCVSDRVPGAVDRAWMAKQPMKKYGIRV